MTSTCCHACGLIQLAGAPNCKRCGQPFAATHADAAPPFGAPASDHTRPYAPDAAGDHAHAPQEPPHESPYTHAPGAHGTYGQTPYNHTPYDQNPYGHTDYTYSQHGHAPYTSSTQGYAGYRPPPPPRASALQGGPKTIKVAAGLIISLVVFVAVGALQGVLPHSRPNWRPYTDPGRGFTVQMPATPTSKVKPLHNVHLGQLQGYETVADLNDDEACVILYTDYPAAIKAETPDQVLEEAVDGMSSDRFTLLSQKSITLGDVPGLEVEMRAPADIVADGQAYGRLYYVGTRLYIIMLLGPRDGALVRERARFLDSFQLLNVPSR